MEQRQKKIIVPIDFSAPALRALEVAAGFARKRQSEIILLYVTNPVYAFLDRMYVSDQAEERRQAASTRMDELAEPLRREGIQVSKMFAKGKAYSEILKTAEEILAEMIVMGVHGHEQPVPGLIGSNANKVLRSARVPVVTTSTIPVITPPTRIIIPADPAEDLDEVRRFLSQFDGNYRPSLHLLGIVAPYEYASRDQEALAGLQAQAQLLSPLADVTCTVQRGALIAEVLLATLQRESYDMVWMETHTRKGLTGMLLSGIAEDILANCEIPVMSLPPRG